MKRVKDGNYTTATMHVARLIDSDSIGFSVYSPPFSNLYIYSDSDYDMGNSVDDGEFMRHYSYLAEELYRITKPGKTYNFTAKTFL